MQSDQQQCKEQPVAKQGEHKPTTMYGKKEAITMQGEE
jgi:hypothetical protein